MAHVFLAGDSGLDIRTLLFFSASVVAINVVVAGLLFRSTRLPGTLAWAVGAACVTVGITLVAMRGFVDDMSSIVVANGLILLVML